MFTKIVWFIFAPTLIMRNHLMVHFTHVGACYVGWFCLCIVLKLLRPGKCQMREKIESFDDFPRLIWCLQFYGRQTVSQLEVVWRQNKAACHTPSFAKFLGVYPGIYPWQQQTWLCACCIKIGNEETIWTHRTPWNAGVDSALKVCISGCQHSDWCKCLVLCCASLTSSWLLLRASTLNSLFYFQCWKCPHLWCILHPLKQQQVLWIDSTNPVYAGCGHDWSNSLRKEIERRYRTVCHMPAMLNCEPERSWVWAESFSMSLGSKEKNYKQQWIEYCFQAAQVDYWRWPIRTMWSVKSLFEASKFRLEKVIDIPQIYSNIELMKIRYIGEGGKVNFLQEKPREQWMKWVWSMLRGLKHETDMNKYMHSSMLHFPH